MNNAFENFLWEDYPSINTALDQENLNKMNRGIHEIDNRVISLDETKATKIEVSDLFKEVGYEKQTGIITFTRKNGATVTIDTPMEKIQTGIYYNPETEKLVLPLIDGTSMEVDLSRLMKFDEFIDSDTIAFSVNANGTITAIVKNGSITEEHLRPDYLADIKVEAAKAESSSSSAEDYAKQAESYAVGTGNARPNEAKDNAKSYAEDAKDYAESWRGFVVTQAEYSALVDSGQVKDDQPYYITDADNSLSEATETTPGIVIVDSELSETSENPVQNKAVTSAIDEVREQESAFSQPRGVYAGNIDYLYSSDSAGMYWFNAGEASGTFPASGYFALDVIPAGNGVSVHIAVMYTGDGVAVKAYIRMYVNNVWSEWRDLTGDYMRGKELTQEQYDVLPETEKMNGTVYFITD